jgi:hypothetical protein
MSSYNFDLTIDLKSWSTSDDIAGTKTSIGVTSCEPLVSTIENSPDHSVLEPPAKGKKPGRDLKHNKCSHVRNPTSIFDALLALDLQL